MTTDPKALIEMLEDHRYPLSETECRMVAQALRDLTTEKRRLELDYLALDGQAVELAEKNARIKALGDGLARFAVHDSACAGLIPEYEGEELIVTFPHGCTCGLSAALAAWETRDEG